MKRFVYSPSVAAYIKTDDRVIDVSSDIIRGSVTRRVNAASQANLTLQNAGRKYLRLIKPMDRIAIYLTRIKPMLVFSGYIDGVTIDQLYPGPINLRATCTIKRLLHTYWDPSLGYVQAFFAAHGWTWDTQSGNIFDNTGRSLGVNLDINNGIGEMIRLVMNEVGGWPIGREGENQNSVHVLQLPPKFLSKTEALIAKELQAIEQQREDIQNLLRQLLTVDGAFGDPFSSSATVPDSTDLQSNYTDNNPLPKSMAREYKATIYGKAVTMDAGAVPDSFSGQMRVNRQKYGDAAAAAAKKYAVPFHIFFGLVRQESGWGTISGGEVDGTNYAGAMGLTQVVPPKYGHGGSDIAGNAELQLDLGAHYLADQYADFKDWKLALAAYNAGPGAVHQYNGIPPYKETQEYVPKVLKWAEEELAASKKSGKTDNTKPDGKPGDVKVWPGFLPEKSMDVYNYTFRIKGNPYGDDKMIFQLREIDRKLSPNEISIYIPANTDQAQNWTDKNVTLETSTGKTQRFQKSDAKAASTPANVDMSKMTQQDLTGGGASTTGLKPIALTGLAFIQSTFGPFKLTAGYATSGHATDSDHYKGLALDLVPLTYPGSSKEPEAITQDGVETHGDQTPLRVILHDTEGETDVSNLGHFFRDNTAGFGCHIGVGQDGTVIRLAPDNKVTYHTADHNQDSLGLEMGAPSGAADSYSKNDWLRFSAQFERVAQQIAYWCHAYDIPAVISTERGISTHAMNKASDPSQQHHDPGANYPFEELVTRVKQIVNKGNVASGGAPTQWTTEGIARADALATWAGWSPNEGGNASGNPVTRWVGWRTEADHGPPATAGTNAHIHISFLADASVDKIPAAKGGGSAGTSQSQQYGTTGVSINQDTVAEIAASVQLGLPLVFPLAMNEAEANNFAGDRALYNDVPLMEFVDFMCKASGRHFMSMPNGDFVAFYPDFFNWGGELPLLRIADIETMNLEIELSDDQLATHVFTTADTLNLNAELDWTEKMSSTVASVESIDTFRELINVTNDFKSEDFLKRYGARPLHIEVPEIKNGLMQFMFGWMNFLEQWSKMFQASPTFTFLPELYPGTLIEFESKDLMMYVEEVTHNFDLAGGFTTSANLSAPSTMSKSFDYGMVLSNGFKKKPDPQPNDTSGKRTKQTTNKGVRKTN